MRERTEMASIQDLVKNAPGGATAPAYPMGGDVKIAAHFYRPQQWGPDTVVDVFEFSTQPQPVLGNRWKQFLLWAPDRSYVDVYRAVSPTDNNAVHVTRLVRRTSTKDGKGLENPFWSGPMDGLWYNLNVPRKADAKVSYTGTYVQQARRPQQQQQQQQPVSAAVTALSPATTPQSDSDDGDIRF